MKRQYILMTAAISVLAAAALSACGNTAEQLPSETVSTQGTMETVADTAAEAPDPFAEFDFGGESIRLLVSAIDNGGISASIYTIRDDPDSTGDIVCEAVYKRNLEVEELLNVDFSYTESNNNCDVIAQILKKLISAGDDSYELIIHTLYPLASMSVQGYFLNIRDGAYFDFSEPWWYNGYMEDICFQSNDRTYILAGDYFMDILRSAHALYFNKDMFASLYDSADVLYDTVREGKWTQEVFLSYVNDAYRDVNGNGVHDEGDIFGYGYASKWGSMIPWVISSDVTFLSFESDGKPVFAMNNEHSADVLERLNEIFYADGAFDYADVLGNTDRFLAGETLFCGYQRIGTLEKIRDMQADVGVLPYPKFDEAQKSYQTSTHDTTCVGVIPTTCTKLDTVSAALEVLSRKTYESVMPAYYETALKIKYSRDNGSAQMLDIIRSNISCVFPLAYGNYCLEMPLKGAFSEPLQAGSTDFVSGYLKKENAAQKKLDELWDVFTSIKD